MIVLLLLCVVSGVLIGYISSERPGHVSMDSVLNRQVTCGQFCLRIAASLYGISCDESHVLLICPPSEYGTRLGRLQNTASMIGMKADVTKLTWEKLFDMQHLVILHVNNNHYVLANPKEKSGDTVRVYDPDLGPRWHNKKSLEAIWQGTSLVLVKDPNFRSGALILTPSFMIDEGNVTNEDEALYFLP
jgi:ABC-type bacteriocin/lantibiotic exporter with double-glycine peptidase domain